MNKKIIFLLVLLSCAAATIAQSARVAKRMTPLAKLVIVDADAAHPGSTISKNYRIAMPFPDKNAATGGRTQVMDQVNTILLDNKIDCPPKRSQITDNIWLCGNGKKISTDDSRLKQLLTEAWKENQ
jgi:hypothetical protein